MGNKRKNIIGILVVSGGAIWAVAKPIGLLIMGIASLAGREQDLQALWELLKSMYATNSIVSLGPWVLIIGGVTSLIWTNFGIQIRDFFKGKISNEELARKCEEMSQEITDFIFERETQAPPFHPLEREEHSEAETWKRFATRAQYSNQTRSLYAKKIGPKMFNLYSMLIENGHKPDDILTFGDDSWADRKSGKLLSYARVIRNGEKIIDDRFEQARLMKEREQELKELEQKQNV